MGFWRDFLIGPEWETRSDSSSSVDEDGIVIPSRASASSHVSSSDAVRSISVYRPVQVINTACAQLSLDVYRGDEKLPRPGIISRPDIRSTFRAFIQETVTSLALQGNAYWFVERDDQGRLKNLEILNPLQCEPITNSWGRVTGYSYAGREKPYTPSQVKHLKLLRIPGQVKGLGPIQAAQAELRGSLDLRDYAAEWFQTSGVPSGTLSSDQFVGPEQAEEARKQWDELPAGKTRVLGNGLKYQSNLISPADAQFLENRQFSTTDLARLFGIPAGLMLAAVEGNSQTYSNVTASWTELSRFTLPFYVGEIEDAFTELLPRGQVAVFNYEALLRPDSETRSRILAKADYMTYDEIRSIEGLPPLPNGAGKNLRTTYFSNSNSSSKSTSSSDSPSEDGAKTNE